MSVPNCDACTNIREYAPLFQTQGVTDVVAASLQNNTGLNPFLPILHENCQDLNDLNDCLLGRFGQELATHDVCDWKEYMSKMAPSLYELFKAIIAGDCGQWGMLQDLCILLQQQMQGNLDEYGILVGSKLKVYEERKGGEIPLAGGVPAARWRFTEPTPGDDYDSLGIEYKKMVLRGCDGVYRTYEWILPRMHCFYYGTGVTLDSVIWRADIGTLRRWGLTESLIETLRIYPQWWIGAGNSVGMTVTTTLKLIVEGDYLNLVLIGATATPANRYVDYMPRTPMLHIT